MRFQTIALSFFVVISVISLVVFANAPKTSKDPTIKGAQGNVVIWGTFSNTPELTALVVEFNKQYKDSFSISYKFHDPKNFDTDIVEALASGTGPDILLLPDDLILRHSDKIGLISYQSVTKKTFSDSYIQAAEVYMREQGLSALPFAIDPMVMYWNRDIFNNASIASPPTYWDEFLSLTQKLTKIDPKTSDITQSAVSFGEFINVTHAKDILAMLFLQVGNKIIEVDSAGNPTAKVAKNVNGDVFVPDQDVVSAFRFFMDFSNPQKSIYTWNRAKANSQQEFINGNLAVYFDYASAFKTISTKNPHLNFAVAQVPLPRGTKAEVTFAKVHGLAVLKSSKNQTTAFIAVQKLLTDANASKAFASAFNLPPVRRDQLRSKPTDAALSVFYDAAIRSRTWLDPKPAQSDKAFQNMVESVSSGRFDVGGAVMKMNSELVAR